MLFEHHDPITFDLRLSSVAYMQCPGFILESLHYGWLLMLDFLHLTKITALKAQIPVSCIISILIRFYNKIQLFEGHAITPSHLDGWRANSVNLPVHLSHNFM